MKHYLATLKHLDSLQVQIWTHLDLLQSENSAGPLQQLYEQIVLLQNNINMTRGQLVRDRLRLMVAEKNIVPTAPTTSIRSCAWPESPSGKSG
ncbi:hypothetical protein V2G26_017315 [Clonostachys chloroleuca]